MIAAALLHLQSRLLQLQQELLLHLFLFSALKLLPFTQPLLFSFSMLPLLPQDSLFLLALLLFVFVFPLLLFIVPVPFSCCRLFLLLLLNFH